MDKAQYNALDIATYFISVSQKQLIDEGVPEGITHLKLQKILYFAQAAYLSLQGKPLFNDEIQAWKYGPVIPTVYKHFQKYKNDPLPEVALNERIKQDEETQTFLQGIWELFGKYSASELVEITHNQAPWKEAYKEVGTTGENAVISLESMMEYYKDIFRYQDQEQSEG